MKKANFKAILARLLVGVMGVSMTACSGNGDTASSGESSSAENSSAASASEELPEPVELNIASFRVGTHNAAAAETRYVTEFQELYNGVDKQKITINIEESPAIRSITTKCWYVLPPTPCPMFLKETTAF